MRSSESGQNLGAGYETSITREEGEFEDGPLKNQDDAGRQARFTGSRSIYGSQCYRTLGNHSEKTGWAGFIGGTLEQLISDFHDQLREADEEIEMIQRRRQRIQQRLNRYEEIKKLTED